MYRYNLKNYTYNKDSKGFTLFWWSLFTYSVDHR